MIKVSGLEQVMSNLNKAMAKLEKTTNAGLYEAALFVKAKALPLTPIDLGNLRGSCFVLGVYNQEYSNISFKGPQSEKISHSMEVAKQEASSMLSLGNKKDQVCVVLGYGAFYAAYVHENPNAGKFAGQWKFLETAIQQYSPQILEIIAERARL